MDDKLFSRVDRYAQFGLVSTKEALEDSGLQMEKNAGSSFGEYLSVRVWAVWLWVEREITQLYDNSKPHRVHPNFIPTITLNSASGIIALAYGAKGPNVTISTACSSSVHALGQAFTLDSKWKEKPTWSSPSEADSSITPLVFAGFCSLRALSTGYNDSPAQASRPFDSGRDGFVMGEGAGTLILESLRHAKRRGAKIYGEVIGYAAASEAYHMVVPREDGSDIARTIQLALEDAEIRPAQIDYVNAHATSTMVGDEVEVKGLHQVFKSRANKLLINATKSLIGHPLGRRRSYWGDCVNPSAPYGSDPPHH